MSKPSGEMHFYVWRSRDDTYHVQNIVMGHLGQHHVHSERSYRRWAKKVDRRLIHYMGEKECDCNLKPGYIREYDGAVWYKPEFEGEKA